MRPSHALMYLRIHRNKSTTEAATLTFINKGRLERIESGDVDPSYKEVARLLRIYLMPQSLFERCAEYFDSSEFRMLDERHKAPGAKFYIVQLLSQADTQHCLNGHDKPSIKSDTLWKAMRTTKCGPYRKRTAVSPEDD